MTFKFWIPRRNNRTNPRIWPTAMQYSPFQATTVIIYMNEHFINWPIALYTICAETYHQKEIRTQFLSQFQVVIRTLRNNAWQSQSKKTISTQNEDISRWSQIHNILRGNSPAKTPALIAILTFIFNSFTVYVVVKQIQAAYRMVASR